MELTVLGTCGAWPGPGRAASGYLVRHDGFNLVMDLGTGTLANLQTHIGYDEIGAVVISHRHPDHCIDLFALYIARRLHPGGLPPLPLVAPPEVFDPLTGLEDEEGARLMRAAFDVREVDPGASYELGPFAVESRRMQHPPPTQGLRISADGVVLAYTGDTAPTPAVGEIGAGADLLISEASWLDGQDVGSRPIHLTARQAAEHAAGAGARRLMLTHFWPTNDREASRAQAAEVFDDAGLLLATEGATIEVGS